MTRVLASSLSSSIGRRCKATVLSALPVATKRPSGLNATEWMGPSWPNSVSWFRPVARSHLGGAIEAAGARASVRAHGNAHDRAGVPPQRRELSAGLRIPDLRRPVPAGRDHLSVAAEREVLEIIGMAAQGLHVLEGVGVPHDDRVVSIVGRDQESTVGAEAEGPRWKTGVDSPQFLARGGIPQPEGLVIAAGRQETPVRADATDVAAMECPVSFVTSFPVVTSQTGTVATVSSPTLPAAPTSRVPSELNTILLIVRSWPLNATIRAPVSTSRIVTPATWPGTAKLVPSGLNETPLMRSAAPGTVSQSRPPVGLMSQSRAVPSNPPVSSRCPSSVNATWSTVMLCPLSVSRSRRSPHPISGRSRRPRRWRSACRRSCTRCWRWAPCGQRTR